MGPDDAVAELTRYLHVQSVVADLLATVVTTPLDQVDGAVDHVLAVLGDLCGVDRTYVFAVDGATMDNTHEWCAAGVQPEIDNLRHIPFDAIQAWHEPLHAGRVVLVEDVEQLPADREVERELLADQGIRSLLVTPMLSGGQLVGFMGLDAVGATRTFLPGEVQLLRSTADVIGSALVRARSERVVRAADRRLLALTRSITDLIAVLDDDLVVSFASESHDRIGRDPAELVGRPWTDLLTLHDAARLHAIVATLGGRIGVGVGDVPVRVGGAERWLEITLSDMRGDGAVAGILLTAHDVTERRRTQQRLAHEATHDALTGLPNRHLLVEHLDAAAAGGQELAVLFIDIDRFKLVNDSLGHAVGDELLIAVGQRLRRLAEGHVVGRFGGDEFVVVVADPDPAVIDRLLADLLHGLRDGVPLGGGRHFVTTSIGIATTWTSGGQADALMRDADTAMYVAKERGRNQGAWFDPAFRQHAVRREALYRSLPGALADGRLTVAYQPILDLARDEVTDVEALARWTDPALGAVPPDEFIRAAEELGLIGRLGEQVLCEALGALAARPGDLAMSVNLSPRQLADPGLPGRVEAHLHRHGLPGGRLTLEITESVLVDQPLVTRRVLADLRTLGVRVALDDFGTGYSSLSQLRGLPIDVLKVDRSFIAELTAGDRDRRFVRAIVALGADLGMSVTAEGVETEAQLAILRELGCARAQGWLIGRPAPRIPQAAKALLAVPHR